MMHTQGCMIPICMLPMIRICMLLKMIPICMLPNTKCRYVNVEFPKIDTITHASTQAHMHECTHTCTHTCTHEYTREYTCIHIGSNVEAAKMMGFPPLCKRGITNQKTRLIHPYS